MRILTILLLLSILCLTASADAEIIGCSCECPEAPDANIRTIYANGTNESNCQTSCGGICGGTSHCGLNLVGGGCDDCCDTYCSLVTPADAKTACIDNCKEVCGVKSILIDIASMLSYIAVAVAAVLFAICGIGILTADDPEARDSAKKCILYIIIALVIISLAALIVALFTGIEIGSVVGGAESATILSGEYTANC